MSSCGGALAELVLGWDIKVPGEGWLQGSQQINGVKIKDN